MITFFFPVMRSFKIYSPSNFQIYNMVLLIHHANYTLHLQDLFYFDHFIHFAHPHTLYLW